MNKFNPDKLINYMIAKVLPIRGNYVQFCAVYNIDYSWLSKFMNRRISNPTVRSLEALESAVDDWNKQ